MADTDNLQDFIADCEWKTRKILRESNKRMKDSSRLVAAKERVELLKQKGKKSADKPPSASATTSKAPSSKSSSKETTLQEWKGRDKIIHDACETIKSFPAKDNNSCLKPNSKTNIQTEIKSGKLHSLYKSPFNDATKGNQAPASAKRTPSKSKSKGPRDNGEPAVVSRRTIERDFYIMSKKRNNPKRKRRQKADNREAKPELKSSVLWKKYRCVDRIMEAKAKQAEKLYEKFERLQTFNGDYDESANEAGDKSDGESSSSSEEEEERAHALQELLDAHVAAENLRSQKRTEKMLMQISFTPDVQAMWEKLEQGGNRVGPKSSSGITKSESQIQSVPLTVATKKFFSTPPIDLGTSKQYQTISPDGLHHKEIVSYVSPYSEPVKVLNLVSNEPLEFDLLRRAAPLSISISYEYTPTPETSVDGFWVYELYDPCNGSLWKYRLNSDEFNLFNSRYKDQTSDSVYATATKKIVYQQQSPEGNSLDAFHVVIVSVNGLEITATIHQNKGPHNNDSLFDINSLGEDIDTIYSFQTCQVLQLLGKQQIYSGFDKEFWMRDDNGIAIWNPLIDLICKNEYGALVEGDTILRSIAAHDSFVAIKSDLGKVGRIEEVKQIFHGLRSPTRANGKTKPGKPDDNIPLLSMRISNHSPYSKTICPGHAVVDRRPGIWRLSSPLVEEDTNSLFPIWLTDVKYPTHLDKTRASAFFYYKNLGSQRGASVTTLSRLAFESPIFSPYCYAIDRGFIAPPFSQPELVDGTIPAIKVPCDSLLKNPVKSRFDTLLPPTVIVLDPAAIDEDWADAPRDSMGNVYHVRNKDEFNNDGFRIKSTAHKIKNDDTINSMVYGISEKAAIPNSKATTPFATDKSTECCTRYLSRKRTASDYHYIAESDGEGTLNVPYLFATHMKAYRSVHVSRKSITSYQDEELFLLATKEAEAKKAELDLKVKAAEEIAEARLKEKMEKIHQSMKLTTLTESKGVDLPSTLCTADEIKSSPSKSDNESNEMRESSPSNESSDNCETDELEQMANMLLNNSNFLRAIARKLDISEDRVKQLDREPAPPTIDQPDTVNDNLEGQLNPAKDKTEPSTERERPSVPKLDLSCKTYKGPNVVGLRGDGWKRLPRADTLIGQFKLTARKVQKNQTGAKFNGFEGRRNFFSVNAVEEIQYSSDPESFGIKTTTMFIPDLATERLRLSKSKRQQKHYEKSLLSEEQKYSLQEILQIPVSGNQSNNDATESKADRVNVDEAFAEYEETEHSTDQGSNSVDCVTKAILAVKNHNLHTLECILDAEGLSVETRDNHGNTLFILACQQGSKRLAKFLLRRGADINAQNNGGNTALHYLHEYHHTLLAEYLLRKGANDAIRNAEGLTVYEGVQVHT